jgi:hypothetical protein
VFSLLGLLQFVPKTPSDCYETCKELPTHMANTGEERLVLYAQMANLVQMMVDSNDVKIKEVTKDFCRVSKHLDFVFPSRNEIGWDSGSGDAEFDFDSCISFAGSILQIHDF